MTNKLMSLADFMASDMFTDELKEILLKGNRLVRFTDIERKVDFVILPPSLLRKGRIPKPKRRPGRGTPVIKFYLCDSLYTAVLFHPTHPTVGVTDVTPILAATKIRNYAHRHNLLLEMDTRRYFIMVTLPELKVIIEALKFTGLSEALTEKLSNRLCQITEGKSDGK